MRELRIVYVSGDSTLDGSCDTVPTDLYVVPTPAARAALPRRSPGAAEPDDTEYYPALSPDDALIAFTRIAGVGQRVDQPGSRGCRLVVQRRAGQRAPCA